MNTLHIASFNDRASADMLRSRFEMSGIPAVVRDESRLQRYWFHSPDLAAYKVDVPHDAYEKAGRLLKEWDANDGMLKNATRCPECRSVRVEYPQFTRKFASPAVLVEIGVFMKAIPRSFYCEDCQHTWPDREPLHQKLDILGWPKERSPG
ncbi:MAG TPA: DUF2007 domain-containing protein [Roseimicrobium sp.]|nr:DUF2007 domain-containing protein [Roseimicrobium sp.]